MKTTALDFFNTSFFQPIPFSRKFNMSNTQANKQKQLAKTRKQAGLTLVEVLSSLTISGLVIGGALAMYGSSDSSQKTNQMNADISALSVAIKSLYASQGGYGTSGLTASLVGAGKVPPTLFVGGTTAAPVLSHGMGGTVIPTGKTNSFTIALTNIPKDVCVNLATASMVNVTLATTAVTTAKKLPFTPADAVAACGTGPSTAMTYEVI